MEITGKVLDQATGKPLAGVTIWEIMPDGQSAEVVGFSDASGNYDVNVNNAGSNINYVLDGYQGTNISGGAAQLTDAVLLQRDGSFTAKLTLSNVPPWVWLLLATVGIYYLGDKKK